MLEETKLIAIKKELITFATLVEGMIEGSIVGLKSKDEDLLQKIITRDEPRCNDFDITLEERCIAMIAQHQPAAKSLRTILMMLKIIHTLERMGDHAVTLCESALYLIKRPQVKPLIDTPKMAETVIEMLREGIYSFINEKSALAQEVCEMDNIVDRLRDQIFEELIDFMKKDPATIERSLHLMKIASNLERVADLTTNISEDIIYMVKGKVIKHHKDQLE
ncbi:MAG: phosphate signaling complex protein PhoU [Thermodesulfobacteriota bacterium]|nr:phosphate signaling complex protein PhoU [Thermodesulfobacteriota bacterium]